jgi:hypothetical protein
MISALQSFDEITAAGILARAALAIHYNPAGAMNLVPNEQQVREAVLQEAAERNGVFGDRASPDWIEKISEILDRERDALIEPKDVRPALERLSTRGTLPSDLFEVNILHDIPKFHLGNYPREENYILATVKTPDKEQHFGPPSVEGQPFLVSLFAKHFADKFPLRSFTMLVAGQRNGLALDVLQAWRIYPDFDVQGADTLVDMLRKFSDQFGVEVTVGEQKGHFILTAQTDREISAEWNVNEGETAKKGNQQHRSISVSFFRQVNPVTKLAQSSLIVAIDLNKYRRFLESRNY